MSFEEIGEEIGEEIEVRFETHIFTITHSIYRIRFKCHLLSKWGDAMKKAPENMWHCNSCKFTKKVGPIP